MKKERRRERYNVYIRGEEGGKTMLASKMLAKLFAMFQYNVFIDPLANICETILAVIPRV